jgi:hypothetical protein
MSYISLFEQGMQIATKHILFHFFAAERPSLCCTSFLLLLLLHAVIRRHLVAEILSFLQKKHIADLKGRCDHQ